MKLSTFVYAVLCVAILTPVVRSNTFFPCQLAATTQELLGVSFSVAVDSTNCNGDLEAATQASIGDFLIVSLADVTGSTAQLGVFELQLEDLCPDERRNLIADSSEHRGLVNWFYSWNGDGTCTYCGEDDDDHYRRRLLEPASIVSLQSLLSSHLTELATVTFSNDAASCLYGKTITVTADVYEETASTGCN